MKKLHPDRREFLATGLFAAALGGTVLLVKDEILTKNETASDDRVTMLMADGTLVEVPQSLVAGQLETSLRATNKEVQDWIEHNKH